MLSLAALSLLLSVTPARAPAFELRALGVLGGDADGNLSAYLLGPPGEPATLLIDGGSLVPGIVRWRQREHALGADPSPNEQARAALAALQPVQALLVTHAHLDHVAGFLQSSTLEVGLAAGGHASLSVVALPATEKALAEHVFHSPLWADFTAIPAGHPALTLAPLEPGATKAVGGFEVQDVALNHPVDCAAYLLTRGGESYLHLGDTGPTQAVWDLARPALDQGHLRAVAVEVSFPSADEKLALSSGHLTPRLLLRELNKLARAEPALPEGPLSDAQVQALAARLAPHFRETPVIAIHIKAAKYDEVVKELKAFQAAGLNLIIPEQGERYRF
jgi:cAMP phosphodiesterase